MEQQHGGRAEQPPEEPNLTEVFADKEYVLFGVHGTIADLKAMCPVRDDPTRMTREAENKFVVMAVNEAGGEIPPEHAKYFEQVLERQGVEPKFVVAETQPQKEQAKAAKRPLQANLAALASQQPKPESRQPEFKIRPVPPPTPEQIIMVQQPPPEAVPDLIQAAEVALTEIKAPEHPRTTEANRALPTTKLVENQTKKFEFTANTDRASAATIFTRQAETMDELIGDQTFQETEPAEQSDLTIKQVVFEAAATLNSNAIQESESSVEQSLEQLPAVLRTILERPPLTFAELLHADRSSETDSPEASPVESTEQPPISEDILAYAHLLFEAEPEREQAVARLVEEAGQIAEMLVAKPDALESPEMAAVVTRLHEVCEQILEGLDIEYEPADIERMVHAILHEEITKLYLLQPEQSYVDPGTHESKLAEWFNGFMQQIDLSDLLPPFVGRLALRLNIEV